MELKKALDIANSIVDLFSSECEIVGVAGSCRRKKPEVKDIEIVALPKMVAAKDLFGEDPSKKIRSDEWKSKVLSLGNVVKGKTDGKMMQIELPQQINLDLFMPDDFDFWRQFAIRTGSADWVKKNVATKWGVLGWCGSDVGLRMKSQCKGEKGSDDKMHWKCIVPPNQQMLPPHWKSEEEFFEWLKTPFIHPSQREVQ